jgi:hypothetical protein
MYSSTLSLTSALDRGGWKTPRPGRFTSDKETRCARDWVDLGAGLEGQEISGPHRGSNPESPSP